MNTLTEYNNNGLPMHLCKVDRDGCLIDGIEPLYYYDSRYDVWCIYENKDYKETGNYNCYYMKSDGRIIIRHADPRRFIGGVGKFYLTDETNRVKVGRKTYFKRYIINYEGKRFGENGFVGIKRLEASDFFHGRATSVSFEVAEFPTEESAKRIEFGFSPMCKHYKIDINLDNWSSKWWELSDMRFNEAITLGV